MRPLQVAAKRQAFGDLDRISDRKLRPSSAKQPQAGFYNERPERRTSSNIHHTNWVHKGRASERLPVPVSESVLYWMPLLPWSRDEASSVNYASSASDDSAIPRMVLCASANRPSDFWKCSSHALLQLQACPLEVPTIALGQAFSLAVSCLIVQRCPAIEG